METRLRIAAIVATASLLLVIFELVRRKRLMERYAIMWLLAGTTLIVLAVWKGLLTTLANKVGIFYPPSALFAVALAVILILLLHFSLVISRLSDQNKVLAQRLGMLQERLDEHDRARGALGQPAAGGPDASPAGPDEQASPIEELSRTG